MTTITLNQPCYVPNTRQQFTRRVTYLVGYFSGSAFVKRGNYDNFEQAVTHRDRLLDVGYDARIIETRIELFVVL